MVDWEWVDRKRHDGWSWEEIAADGRASFVPDGSGVAPGRQLRNLSRERFRDGGSLPTAPAPTGRFPHWSLARVGWVLFPLFAPWALLAYLLPSPVGVYVGAIPVLGFLAAASGVILAWGTLRQAKRWTPVFKQTATFASVAGLVLAGALGTTAILNHCPVLSPFLTSEPGGWQRVPQASWSSQGAPVLFFYGSVACPYCSASSWAVLAALQRLGNVSGVTYDHSSSSDVYPNTPSVVLPELALASRFVTLDAKEARNDQQVESPSLAGCPEEAYVNAYDPFGSVPFIVLGGTFVHSGGLVDPGALTGLNATQVAGQLSGHEGSAYTAISSSEDYLLAYLVWLNNQEPASVATDPGVASILDQIH